MSDEISDKAFVLAAGFGKRLRPYTEDTPKPMITVADKPLIDHTIEKLVQSGIREFVVNTHYLAEKIHEHFKNYRYPVHISYEEKILDLGGGVKKMLHVFDGKAFFIVSGDMIWEDRQTPIIERMRAAWDPEKMDILLMLQPVANMHLTKGAGDYDIANDGRLTRSRERNGTHMFASIRLNSSSVFDDTPDGAFSYLDLMDKAQAEGRLYGVVHDGEWHHISTPNDLENVREYFEQKSKNVLVK